MVTGTGLVAHGDSHGQSWVGASDDRILALLCITNASTSLLCRTEFGVDPSDLNEPDSTNDLFRAVMPYQALSVESEADKVSSHNGERLEEEGWEYWVRLDDHDAILMELECNIPHIIATPTLTLPSSAESQRANICGGISINLLHETPPASSPHTHERLYHNSWDS